MSLSRILGWTIDQDRGTFASLTSENSVPLWINAPTEGQDTSCNLILHIEADDVDVAFQRAVDNGAEPSALRSPCRSARAPAPHRCPRRGAGARADRHGLPRALGLRHDRCHPRDANQRLAPPQ